MSRLVKILIALALIVPMTAYVIGSLAASNAEGPDDRSPVILRDGPLPAGSPAPGEDDRRGPKDGTQTRGHTDDDDHDEDDDRHDDAGDDDDEPEVVVPRPTRVGDDDGDDDDRDDDDRDDDERDDDRDDDERDDDEDD